MILTLSTSIFTSQGSTTRSAFCSTSTFFLFFSCLSSSHFNQRSTYSNVLLDSHRGVTCSGWAARQDTTPTTLRAIGTFKSSLRISMIALGPLRQNAKMDEGSTTRSIPQYKLLRYDACDLDVGRRFRITTIQKKRQYSCQFKYVTWTAAFICFANEFVENNFASTHRDLIYKQVRRCGFM